MRLAGYKGGMRAARELSLKGESRVPLPPVLTSAAPSPIRPPKSRPQSRSSSSVGLVRSLQSSTEAMESLLETSSSFFDSAFREEAEGSQAFVKAHFNRHLNDLRLIVSSMKADIRGVISEIAPSRRSTPPAGVARGAEEDAIAEGDSTELKHQLEEKREECNALRRQLVDASREHSSLLLSLQEVSPIVFLGMKGCANGMKERKSSCQCGPFSVKSRER
mmetsp:Transcript_35299/g.91755  ORF Transcript_35299/g.91755 Transcript_35299/m.91755 type:complete len:220 (-) Transcript_35299:2667-3326(-)